MAFRVLAKSRPCRNPSSEWPQTHSFSSRGRCNQQLQSEQPNGNTRNWMLGKFDLLNPIRAQWLKCVGTSSFVQMACLCLRYQLATNSDQTYCRAQHSLTVFLFSERYALRLYIKCNLCRNFPFVVKIGKLKRACAELVNYLSEVWNVGIKSREERKRIFKFNKLRPQVLAQRRQNSEAMRQLHHNSSHPSPCTFIQFN